MNVQSINVQRIIFLIFFLIFLSLCLLSLNEYIVIKNVWFIFTPLWIWNILVFTSLISLSIIKCTRLTKFFLFYCLYQVHIFLFQIFICLKLESDTFPWCVVLIPVFGLCLLGFLTVTKDFRRLNVYELEVFLSLNLPCIILIGLRLDNCIHWSWAVVLIPFWITMAFLVVQLLHGLFLVAILCGSNHFEQKDRNQTIIRITGYSSVAFSFLIFSIFLVCKLDKIHSFTYVEIFSPLIISVILMLILTVFTEYPNNIILEALHTIHGENSSPGYFSGTQSSTNGSSNVVPCQVSNRIVWTNDLPDTCKDIKVRDSSNTCENKTLLDNSSQKILSNTRTTENDLLNKEMHLQIPNQHTSLSLPD
ncbi:unnamed protein product [Trichobilharzia szidati]|nr:unnamed protein product [Trichobilharzia szidati]